jgi:hypothetical protein
MKLYVEPMDVVVVDVDAMGRVRYGGEASGFETAEVWNQPTLQERRAIIYAARQEMAALAELVDILEAR